jgi:hypothetical protein
LIQLKLSGHIKNIIAIFKEVDEARKRLWLMPGVIVADELFRRKRKSKEWMF